MNDENLTFLTASDFGSFLGRVSGLREWGTSDEAAIGFVPTDFAGMNTNIQEPLTSSENLLGYPVGTRLVRRSPSDVDSYLNHTFVPETSSASYVSGAEAFNALILHRQGPYGWPTWKQVRTGNHPVNRYHRKNNIFSYARKSLEGKTAYGKDNNVSIFKTEDIKFQKIVPPLSERHQPLRHSFLVAQNNEQTNFFLKHSYGNIKEHYSS